MKASKTTNVALAVAAASLFAFAPVMSHAAEDAKVHCYGVNSCKGKNDCKSASNGCKGQSACKGQGFLAMSQKECDKAGGKVEESKGM